MRPLLNRTAFLIAICAAVAAWTVTAQTPGETNSLVAAQTGHLMDFATPQATSEYPNLSNVLFNGVDGGYQMIRNLQRIGNIDEIQANDRFHAGWGPSGQGAYAIEGPVTTIADFDVAYHDRDYFGDALSGDVCFRSASGPIRIGYNGIDNNYGSSVIVATNGDVTVTKGALYVIPQGDLLMGSFTNSPPHE